MSQIFTTLNQILGIHAAIMMPIGTFLNLFSFFICFRIKNNTTFIFLRFFAIANVFTLFWWNLNNFLNVFISLNLLTAGLWLCKVGNFVQFASLQIAAWFLVLISVDGVMSVYFTHWKTIYFKPKRAYLASGAVILLFLLINSNILFLFGYEANLNGTHLMFCFQVQGFPETYWMNTFGQVHFFLYSIVPFLILGVCNVLLILKLKTREVRRARPSIPNLADTVRPSIISLAANTSSRSSRTNKVVIAITLLFIAFTIPLACASFFFNTLFLSDYRTFIVTLFDQISFTYHGCNIFITFFTNLVFKKEFYKLFNKHAVSEANSVGKSRIAVTAIH